LLNELTANDSSGRYLSATMSNIDTATVIAELGGITSQLTQTLGGPASATLREFGVK